MARIASSIIMNSEGKILIMKRSDKVRTYKGMWGVAAGYIEEDETPLETAYKEIREETGIEGEYLTLLKQFEPVEINDIYAVSYTHLTLPTN